MLVNKFRVTENLTPIRVFKSPKGTTIYDMGQNMVGWARLKVSGEAGTKIFIRYAEMLEEDGNLYTENLRRANPVATYLTKGEGIEEFEPHFTYYGFRYVEVICETEKVTSINIEGRVVHSDTPVTGTFKGKMIKLSPFLKNIGEE